MGDHAPEFERMTAHEENVLREAFERDRWAGEWNSLPTAIERVLADRLAPVVALARDLAAWDLADMPVPESVDVPDDYELAMNDAGAQLHTALLNRPGEPS